MTHTSDLHEARPSRRTVVRTAAWSVPVVAAATTAPAYAASPCSDTYSYALDWGNTARTTYTPPATPTGAGVKTGSAYALPPSGSGAASLNVTFQSTVVGTVNRTANNLVFAGTNVGGTGGAGLQLTHDNIQTGRGNRQELQITFDRAVTGLSFSIADIDSSSGAWYDQVELTGNTGTGAAAFTQSPAITTTSTSVVVWGDGSATSPWRPRNDNQNVGAGSNAGNKMVTFTTAVKTLSLVYWNSSGTGNQIIALTDFTFSAKGC
jgi:hypothetical protein